MNIFPCNKYFCKCVEYLNFANKKHLSIYKHCFITSNNNLKYKKITCNTNNINNGFYSHLLYDTKFKENKLKQIHNTYNLCDN